jgi:hypothetical protein
MILSGKFVFLISPISASRRWLGLITGYLTSSCRYHCMPRIHSFLGGLSPGRKHEVVWDPGAGGLLRVLGHVSMAQVVSALPHPHMLWPCYSSAHSGVRKENIIFPGFYKLQVSIDRQVACHMHWGAQRYWAQLQGHKSQHR